MSFEPGDKLTVDHEIIGISGATHLAENERVEILKVKIREGFWGKGSGCWYPDKITGFVIKDHENSVFLPEVFKETKDLYYEF